MDIKCFFYIYLMRPTITISIIVGILIIIIFFVLAVFFSLHINEIYEYINNTIDGFFDNRRPRRTRQRRNAIYIPRQPREIELTPLPKKNFIIIQNPNSPYTLGIEHSSE